MFKYAPSDTQIQGRKNFTSVMSIIVQPFILSNVGKKELMYISLLTSTV